MSDPKYHIVVDKNNSEGDDPEEISPVNLPSSEILGVGKDEEQAEEIVEREGGGIIVPTETKNKT